MVDAESALFRVNLRFISDLTGTRGFQSELSSCGLEFVRRRDALLFESESLVLFDQTFALVAQRFVFVTKLNCGEVLLRGEYKSAGQDQAAEQQHRESRQGGDVSTAMNLGVLLMLRKSFHLYNPWLIFDKP